jgi:hypothetical protein
MDAVDAEVQSCPSPFDSAQGTPSRVEG